jgi:GWxTD domain-containing protein
MTSLHIHARTFVLLVLIGLSGPFRDTEPAFGQSEDYMRLALENTRSRLYHDAFVLPGSVDSSLVVVQFRLPFDRLVFMRHLDGSADQAYRARVEVTIEMYREGEIVSERIWRDEAFAAEYDDTVDKAKSLAGNQTFVLAPGQYAYRLRLADLNTEQAGSSLLRRLAVPDEKAPRFGKAILASAIDTAGGVLRFAPLNLGGDIAFGKTAIAVLPVWSMDAVDSTYGLRYAVRRLDRDKVRKEREKVARRNRQRTRRLEDPPERPKLEPEWAIEGGMVVDSGSVAMEELVLTERFTAADVSQGHVTTVLDTSSTNPAVLMLVDLSGEELEAGTYVLDVFVAADSRPVSSTRFATNWPNMPLSLHSVDVAIRNLEYLIGRRAAADMRKGSSEEREERFLAFWRERDPTPETAVNELMNEYYRRIDHAAFAFRTGSGGLPNGLGTDRADVYIAHGAPSETTRTFPESGGVVEIWEYPDGREFIFESLSSTSEFRLVNDRSNS